MPEPATKMPQIYVAQPFL